MTVSKVCLAGKSKIAVDALLFMIERGWKDRLLVCPNTTDTGTSCWQPSLVSFAQELGIELITLKQAQEIEDLIFISLEFDRIVRPTAFQTDRLYNLHFSALPAYKGMYTSALPILHGAKASGVTLHEIDHGIDTGGVIAQHIFQLADRWTARDLYYRYMERGFDLFRRNFDLLVGEERPVAKGQAAAGSTYYSKASIDYRNLAIDLRKTADEVIRQLKAFSFREYQTPVVAEMEIGDWYILPERSVNRPGTTVERGQDYVVIATIDYNLRLERSRFWEWLNLDHESSFANLDPRNVDISDNMGCTALIKAAYAADVILCRRLLEVGANPNKPDTNGKNPLMYAFSGHKPAQAKQTAMVLLKFGANPDQTDYFGRDLQSYHPSAVVSID